MLREVSKVILVSVTSFCRLNAGKISITKKSNMIWVEKEKEDKRALYGGNGEAELGSLSNNPSK